MLAIGSRFEERERELTTKMKELEQKVDSAEVLIKTIKACQKENDLTKKVMDSLVDKIIIFDGSSIWIELRFGEKIPVTR